MTGSRVRSIITGLLALGAAGFAALLPLLHYGPRLFGMEFFSNFTPLLPLASAACIVILIFLTRDPLIRSGLIGCMVLATAFSVHLLRTHPSPWPVPQAGSRQFKIVEFNSWLGSRDPIGAARWILSERPDVVILSEGGGRSRFMVRILDRTYPYKITCHEGRYCSTMILSRWRPVEMRGLADRDVRGRPSLSAAYMRLAAPGGDIGVVGVHFSWPVPESRQRREMDALAARLEGVPRDGLVIAGDFNATRYSMTIRTLQSRLGVRLVGSDASWPAPPSHLPLPVFLDIDHAFLGTGWTAAKMERGPSAGSDHYPFVITLSRAASSTHSPGAQR